MQSNRFFKTSIFILFFLCIFSIHSFERNHNYVLRGHVYVDFEPIYIGHIDPDYPLDITGAAKRALEEAALIYSAMIYGWTFHYEIGERARGIVEHLDLEPVSVIPFGDAGLRVTDTAVRDNQLWIWTDYHLTAAQQSRLETWRTGITRNIQGTGYGPVFLEEYPGWLLLKMIAQKLALLRVCR